MDDLKIGSLITLQPQYGKTLALYRTTGETPKRWNLEAVGGELWNCDGTKGSRKARYIEKGHRILPVRDEAHFEIIQSAHNVRAQARDAALAQLYAAYEAADKAFAEAIA